jgi:hypothetical protein
LRENGIRVMKETFHHPATNRPAFPAAHSQGIIFFSISIGQDQARGLGRFSGKAFHCARFIYLRCDV